MSRIVAYSCIIDSQKLLGSHEAGKRKAAITRSLVGRAITMDTTMGGKTKVTAMVRKSRKAISEERSKRRKYLTSSHPDKPYEFSLLLCGSSAPCLGRKVSYIENHL